MRLSERIDYLKYIFSLLEETNSRTEKESIVKEIISEMKEDFDYCIRFLNGEYKVGYTYVATEPVGNSDEFESWSVKNLLEFLQMPRYMNTLSNSIVMYYCNRTYKWRDFLSLVVNRELKLGIGASLIEKTDVSPMLAKKFEGSIKPCKEGYYITEKLDGNRCIAKYDGNEWTFTSRNGKKMNVDFDMGNLPKHVIYDGEVLSVEQTAKSNDLYLSLKYGKEFTKYSENEFNKTSGVINSKYKNKNLILNIFDIVDKDNSYLIRRSILNNLSKGFVSNNVRILPVLEHFTNKEEMDKRIYTLLDYVSSCGAEGLMINVGSDCYQQKRTDSLLKLKKVQTMDMRVVGIELGDGKYLGMVGALVAECIQEDGSLVHCNVGSGLSDDQRLHWVMHSEEILGKIIEVAYFEKSRSKNSVEGDYSLRFPRLKSIRDGKSTTSEY